ncbi:MAG: hypothetical protein KDI07_19800 [Anaerolineae bacterium]|nr:hypothetical protein [Anaerolineae bacterium]
MQLDFHPVANIFPLMTGADVYFHQHHIVASAQDKSDIESWCKEHQLVPFICDTPRLEMHGIWWAYTEYAGARDLVFHPGWESYLKSMGYLQPKGKQDVSESIIEDAIFANLKKDGKQPARQVYLTSGIADVVTADELYEVKAYLTRDAVIKAIGQLEIYSQELPGRSKIIVGRHGDGIALRSFANRMGIEMRIWRTKDA